MKLGLFLFAIYFSVVVFAQEPISSPAPILNPGSPLTPTQQQSPKNSEIEKFSYIPPLGTPYMNAGFSYGNSKGAVKGPAGTVYTAKTTLNSFDYVFAYGVSDYLALGLAGRILMTNKSDYDYGSGSTINGTSVSLKQSGWEEPTVEGVWRIRDNTEGKMRMNFGAGVKPKLQQAKYATNTADGNAGIGGTQFFALLELFKEVKDIELQLQVQRSFFTVTHSESASDSSKTVEDDDHQATNIKLGLLAFASDAWTFGGNLVLNITEKYSTTYATSGAKTGSLDNDTGNVSSLELIGKYKVEPKSLIQLTLTSVLGASLSAKSSGITLNNQVDSALGYMLSWVQEF